jgi:hypothetical protein
MLVLSGAILSGCTRREETAKPAKDPQTLTNDTYIAGRGYYHSPFHGFFPFPYNYYSPGMGYYRGGRYHTQPDLKLPRPTAPGRASAPDVMQARAERQRTQSQMQKQTHSARRGGFTRSHSGWSSRS